MDRPWALRHAVAVLAAGAALLAPSTVWAGTTGGTGGTDSTPPAPFDLVADAGQFQTGWQVASPYQNLYVTWRATTDDTSAVRYRVKVDGEVVRTVSESGNPTITKRVEVPDGRHVVSVEALDAAGNRRAATHSLGVLVDTVSPVFTSYPQLLLRTGPVTAAGYPLRFTWSGTDEGTGLAQGWVGPNETCCYRVDPTAGRYDFTVAPRSSTAWRIWLYDGVGRVTRTGRDGYVAPVPWRQTRHTGRWVHSDDPAYLDGWQWVSRHRGDRFTATVEGRSVAWVATTGPSQGRARVLMNGERVATIDLRTPERHTAQVVWTAPVSRLRSTEITVVNASTDRRDLVAVDGFLRQR